MVEDFVSLEVNLAGLRLINPFILAASPATTNGDLILKGFEAGWAGAVTKTIIPDPSLIKNVSPKYSMYFHPTSRKIIGVENIDLTSDRPLIAWLDDIVKVKRRFPDRVLVASIMADVDKRKDWEFLATKCQEKGIDALELNLSCPHGLTERVSGAIIGQDPFLTQEVTSWVKEVSRVPVFVKLTPNITDITIPAKRASQAGAAGIVAINTLLSLNGVDLKTLEPLPSIEGMSTFGGYSGQAIKPVALRMVAELKIRVGLPVIGVGGISGWRDAVEFMLLGADAVQVCTEVMLRGVGIINELKTGLTAFMNDKKFLATKDFVGLSLAKLTSHSKLVRKKRVANINRELCQGCAKCFIACNESGFQAIFSLEEPRKFQVRESRCTGCALCQQICPIENCIKLIQI